MHAKLQILNWGFEDEGYLISRITLLGICIKGSHVGNCPNAFVGLEDTELAVTANVLPQVQGFKSKGKSLDGF